MLSVENRVFAVLGAFADAESPRAYRKAKQMCCRLFPEAGQQLAFVDAARAAKGRIGGAA